MERRLLGNIFISYRIDDTGHVASRLFEDLAELYGSERIFIDHEKIVGGEHWGQRLKAEAAQAAVMFVLIGPGWLKAQNPTTGDRRLNEPEDWVRCEIQTALDSGLSIIPILVDNARPLTPTDLRTVPELARLAEKQSLPLRRPDWETDVTKLQSLLLSLGITPSDKEGKTNPEHRLSSEGSSPNLSLARLGPPTVPPHFRDRDRERQRIADGFRRERPCVLMAIGGSGKTAIAAHIASDRLVAKGQKVMWLGLGGTSDAAVPQEWLANAFGASVRTASTSQQREALLRSITAHHSALIVFDDPVSDDQVSQLMASIGPGNDVLITTREQFTSMVRFGAEIVEVPPLATSDATDVLLSIMGMGLNSLDDRREWGAVAQAVGNHPLSLEVIGGDLQLQDQVDPTLYLQDRIAKGTWSEGEGTLARLRKSLIDSVAHSRHGDDIAFAALSAFEGSAFSVEAVAEVCAFESVDAARRFLLTLRRRLCVRRHASGLYLLHPFVADTARQLQAAQGGDFLTQSAPMHRHITYYNRLLRTNGGYEWNIHRYPLLTPEERELVRAIDNAAALADQFEQNESDALRAKCAEMTSLVSWYLHWRGHWDLRIRLCERICAWAEQKLLPCEHPNTFGIVGNLYVDQGWIHLHRTKFDQAERCAALGQSWLQNSSDMVFATELLGQVALRRHEYVRSIEVFRALRRGLQEGTRFWLVISYRLADALSESGDRAQGLAVLEDARRRSEVPSLGETIDDVRGRILYRIALHCQDAERVDDALILARSATAAFARSGIITPERRAAVALFADLLSQAGATDERCEFLITATEQAEKEGDFETLMEIGPQLAAQESAMSVVSNGATLLADL